MVVRGEVPEHRHAHAILIVAQKQVVRLLPLRIQERVVVVALEAFDDVPRVVLPFVDLAVRGHGVCQVRSAVLDRDCVAMRMEPGQVRSVRDNGTAHMWVNVFTASESYSTVSPEITPNARS
jgi:hypothetical protein